MRLNRFHLPHYWPLWGLLGLLRLVNLLPIRWQWRLGRILGRGIYSISKNSRHVAQVNLNHCFPEWSDSKRQQILKASFDNIGIAFIETGLSLWASPKKLRGLLTLQGYEYIQAAVDKGQGTLLVTGHFTPLALIGRLCAQDYSFGIIYSRQKIAFLNYIVEKAYKRYYDRALPKDAMRQVAKALKNGESIYYTADVNANSRSSVFAPFFGIEALTPTAPSRLAQMSNCHIIPLEYYRDDTTGTYDVRFYPRLAIDGSGDYYEDARQINQAIEKMVRKHPEQYLWQYKRFKKRPDGKDQFYK